MGSTATTVSEVIEQVRRFGHQPVTLMYDDQCNRNTGVWILGAAPFPGRFARRIPIKAFWDDSQDAMDKARCALTGLGQFQPVMRPDGKTVYITWRTAC